MMLMVDDDDDVARDPSGSDKSDSVSIRCGYALYVLAGIREQL